MRFLAFKLGAKFGPGLKVYYVIGDSTGEAGSLVSERAAGKSVRDGPRICCRENIRSKSTLLKDRLM